MNLSRRRHRLSTHAELSRPNLSAGTEEPSPAQTAQPADGSGDHLRRGGGHYHGGDRRRDQESGAGAAPATGSHEHSAPLDTPAGEQSGLATNAAHSGIRPASE